MSRYARRNLSCRNQRSLQRSLIEQLERRDLLAVFNVESRPTGGGDGSPGNPFATIGAAVAAARLSPGLDEIIVAAGTYNENISISSDTDGLIIRGDASARPVVTGVLPFNLILPKASFTFENLVLNGGARAISVDNANSPFTRLGSLTIRNVDATVVQAANNWEPVFATGLNQLTMDNVVLTGGRATLTDINNAQLSRVTVVNSRNNAISANFVSTLVIDGLTATGTTSHGINLGNADRTFSGTGAPPINQTNQITIRNAQISSSLSNGLFASQNMNVSVFNSAFNNNAGSGLLVSQASLRLDQVETSGNQIGVNMGRSGSFNATSIVANDNTINGLNLAGNSQVTIVGAQLLRNASQGINIDSAIGSVSLADVNASNNGGIGITIANVGTSISFTNVVTNDNIRNGLSLIRSTTASTVPTVTVVGGQALRNGVAAGVSGWEMGVVQSLTMSGFEASQNGTYGLSLNGARGAVSVSNSVFRLNGSNSNTSFGGARFTTLQAGLTITDVTASDNSVTGIEINTISDAIKVSGLTATGNKLNGLFLTNVSRIYQSSLSIDRSNFASNGQVGAFAQHQLSVTVKNSKFDQNGPVETATTNFGGGLAIDQAGVGGVIIEDSTALQNRVGRQNGSGMQVTSSNGPMIQFNRVEISGTVTHPLTATTQGAGIAVVGSSGGVRVTDSTFSGNKLLDSVASRAVLFGTSQIIVVNTQFTDNEGVAIAGPDVTLTSSTISGTRGKALLISSGTITRSTISGNIGPTLIGAGSTIESSVALVVDQATITNNTPSPVSSGLSSVISNAGSLSFRNSVVAGNSSDSQVFSNASAVTSNGFNLLSGTPVGWLGSATDLIGDIDHPIDAKLSPLANNGGRTLTHLPLPGSPLIDAGDPGLSGTDQRGLPRPVSYIGLTPAASDIGSVEVAAINSPPAIVLDSRSVSGLEGSLLTLTGRFQDLENNVASITSSLGDIQVNNDGTFTWSLRPTDNITSTVTITAVDAFGLAASDTFSLVVENSLPVLGATNVNVNNNTRFVTVTTSVTDAGSGDSQIVSVVWGDGTRTDLSPNADGTVVFAHQYPQLFEGKLTVFAIDDDGGPSNSFDYIVNSAPSLTLDSSVVLVNEGQVATLTGRMSDLENNVTGIEATTGTVQLNSDGTFVWTYSATDDYFESVRLIAKDSFGAFAVGTFNFSVNNVSPSVGTTRFTVDPINSRVLVTSDVSDPGINDTPLLVVVVDGQAVTIGPDLSGNFSQFVSIPFSGRHTLEVYAVDKDRGRSSSTFYDLVMPGFIQEGGSLVVYGSDLADTVSFASLPKQQMIATGNFGGSILQFAFSRSAISNIVGYLGAGNDTWNGNNISFPQYVYGEAGDDQLTTGSSSDILVGGLGADILRGGTGSDLMIGGAGNDVLYGESGGDVLVAGQYTRETELDSLKKLLSAWNGSGNYQTRVNRLRSGVGVALDSQGVAIRLTIDQITDNAIDQLFGGNDSDWYLTAIASEVRDATREEVRN